MTNPADMDQLLGHAPPTSSVELSRVVQSLRARMFGVSTPKVHIGRYEVVRRVGVGVHGEVFEGLDRDLSRRVAIKVLSGDDARRRHQEARAAASLAHPNVVEVFTIGVHESRPYVAMSFVDGPPLSEWAHEDHDAKARLEVVLGAARGLSAAHAAGLLHGDVKPANVLVDGTGVPKVADFGNAAWIDDGSHGHDIVGTPGYIAPEAYDGGRSEASDQFGLAATAWEVLGGVAPYAGTSEAELREAAEQARLTRPDRHDLPASVFRVLLRGMAPDPRHRWPSIAALADALEDASSPRRRWPWVAAMAVAGLSVLVAFDGEADPCRGIAGDAAAVWGPDRSEQLEGALSGSSPVAADVLPSLRARLDDWTHAWTLARTDACTDVEADRARHCLDTRLLELDETLRVLEDEPSTLRHALGLIAAPSAGFACTTTRADDDDPAAVEIHRLTARSDVLRRVGRGPEAMEAADEALALARESRDAALVLEATIARAMVILLEDRPRGRESLENAAWKALGMERVDIAASAAMVLAANEKTPELQLAWAERAMQWAENPSNQAFISGLNSKATALYVLGRHQESLDVVEEGWPLAEGHPAREFHLMLTRANAHGALGDTEGALRDLIAVRELARDHFGRFHPSYALALNELAIGYAYAGDEDEARKLYLEAVELLERLESPGRINLGRALLNVGLSSRDEDPVAALGWLDRAEAVFQELGDDGVIDLARVEGGRSHVSLMLEDFPKAVRHAKAGVDILSTHLPDDHPLLGQLRSMLEDACLELDEATRPPACDG